MPAKSKQDTGPFELLVAQVRRLARDAEYVELSLVETLNEAYLQGAADARNAITGHRPTGAEARRERCLGSCSRSS
jgi:hypothetical protein